MISGLNHITLGVSQLDRSFDFYVGLLGCQPHARWNSGVYLTAGTVWLCLSLDHAKPAADYTHIAFSVEDGQFEKSCERLMAAGVTQWKENTSEGQSLYFLDPDGHKLELHVGDLASRRKEVAKLPYEGWVEY